MSDVKWIKVSTDMFNTNRKIKQIEIMPEGDTILVIWLKLMLLAGIINDGGSIYITPEIPYTDEMLANELRRPLATVKIALSVFERFGMIEIVDDILKLSSWAKYQSIEGMEKVREQNRARQKKWYDKQKALPNEDVMQPNVRPNVTITHSNGTDIELDIEIENKRESRERVIPSPSLDEVKEYCRKRKSSVDPERFWNYYSAIGWKFNGAPIADWKSVFRNWEKTEKSKPTAAHEPSYGSHEQYETDDQPWMHDKTVLGNL